MKRFKVSSKLPLLILAIPLAIGASFGIIICIKFESVHSPTAPDQTVSQVAPAVVVPSFDKSQFSTTDPTSIWVVTNKQHPLNPIDFTPANLVTTNGATISDKAVTDFEAMLTAATAESVTLTPRSSYRSYGTQNTLYNNYVATNGQIATDTFSARAGFSEHQTGFAVDFVSIYSPQCNFDTCFSTATDGAWLAAYASNYGFILRYTAEKQSITGYKAESWHYRYIGRELAAEMKKQSISTLEEFFGITGGEGYLQ